MLTSDMKTIHNLVGFNSNDTESFTVQWDFKLQIFTIGGGLTIRCELETLAKLLDIKIININLVNSRVNNYDRGIFRDIFSSSKVLFTFNETEYIDNIYPMNLMNVLNDNSYYSTSRLAYLKEITNIQPLLMWNSRFESGKDLMKKSFGDDYIFLHLRLFGLEKESRADIKIWKNLISQVSDISSLPLIFMGNDSYPDDFSKIKGVYFLKNFVPELVSQLSLVPSARMFIGSASGIAGAAMYSEIPYLIFKHPEHHKNEIARELKNGNQFPWALKNQLLLRQHPSLDIIKKFIVSELR